MRRSLVLLTVVEMLLLAVMGPLLVSTSAQATHDTGPQPVPLDSAKLVFPAGNLSLEGNLSDLASFLVSALGLPPVNWTYNNGRYGTMCCLWDFRGNKVGMENGSSAAVGFQGNVGMNLEYSSAGRLAELDLGGPLGTPLASSDWPSMVQRTRDLATALGLGAFPLSFVGSNATGTIAEGVIGTTTSQTTVTAFSDPYSLTLLFANQFTVTFDADRGLVVRLDLFPWFTASPPIVSPTEAASKALTFLNATVVPRNSAIASGSWVSALNPYLGFDSIRNSLAYDVEVTFTADSHNPPGYPTTVSYEYRVWVDAENGTVTSWVWILPHSIPPAELLWPILVALGMAIGISAVLIILVWRRRTSASAKRPEPLPAKPRS